MHLLEFESLKNTSRAKIKYRGTFTLSNKEWNQKTVFLRGQRLMLSRLIGGTRCTRFKLAHQACRMTEAASKRAKRGWVPPGLPRALPPARPAGSVLNLRDMFARTHFTKTDHKAASAACSSGVFSASKRNELASASASAVALLARQKEQCAHCSSMLHHCSVHQGMHCGPACVAVSFCCCSSCSGPSGSCRSPSSLSQHLYLHEIDKHQ